MTDVVLDVAGMAWFERLLLQLGPDASVVRPPELTDLAARAARKVLRCTTGRSARRALLTTVVAPADRSPLNAAAIGWAGETRTLPRTEAGCSESTA